MPKYEEIADTLRQRIKQGIYPANSLLPNQVELVEEFDASRMTVKKAITILTMEGLVFARRGAGTKVLDHSFWNKTTAPADQYRGMSFDLADANQTLTSKVITFKVTFPSPEVKERLTLSAQQPVYEIIRLRIVDGVNSVLEHTYMPVNLAPGLTDEILEGSIYSYLKKERHLTFAGAFRNIQADKADKYDQEYLDCAPTDPVLEVEQVVYLDSGQPIEYSRSRNRYDRRGYTYLDVKNC
ncbi:GntR family transcriptional regulator [Latilactobacillus sakei]|uniref:GntR family transcriptional regulator n=1 Tax=Latilactobacillus sakei TaxID=1599 RepID=A0A223K488_LATSK|nr:GntR family transcriptional regulator [Latilactobacillus sakei]AST84329.1 GntR family transcriptional regulator [Latilactobacillus sakei]AWZ42277.1 GntR family transcriptional regulator [Latilactobacillus sakei]AWZ46553.1 GntR family transcriptional regulator [Latilactobacillus sakei]AYG15660.1 GntR family transcriptional regulator [Latilactobacillus sakei]AYG26172.1 GntR family transcriptional regulator [Latilactobacillus sakei]